jgi:hypothetical protein
MHSPSRKFEQHCVVLRPEPDLRGFNERAISLPVDATCVHKVCDGLTGKSIASGLAQDVDHLGVKGYALRIAVKPNNGRHHNRPTAGRNTSTIRTIVCAAHSMSSTSESNDSDGVLPYTAIRDPLRSSSRSQAIG